MLSPMFRSACRSLPYVNGEFRVQRRAVLSFRALSSIKAARNSSSEENMIRLSKRMSELDMCSRREADDWITRNKVLVQGVPAVLGQKVDPNEIDITIASPQSARALNDNLYDAVVMHKPRGFVSSQPEEDKAPAVRLLTPGNRYRNSESEDDDADCDDFTEHNYRRIRRPNGTVDTTLSGYAVAGRLDQDSTGLLIFCRSGVLAKKLVAGDGLVEKEYLVQVEEAKKVRYEEKQLGLKKLPAPTLNLSILQNGGAMLAGELKPLKKIRAEWIREGQILKIVLLEGKKRQIRRMMRQLMGYHVVRIHRVRIGPIKLDMPERTWRPLRRDEVDAIIAAK